MFCKRIHLLKRTRAALDGKINFSIPLKTQLMPVQMELMASDTVTQPEIDLWLLAVPNIPPDSPRAATYTRDYDVAGKVARAKADGTFHAIIAAGNHFIEP